MRGIKFMEQNGLTIEEVEEMKKTIEELSRKVKAQERILKEKKSSKGRIWELAGKEPIGGIDHIGRSSDRIESIKYFTGNSVIRNAFLVLAKEIHNPIQSFKQRDINESYPDYFDSEHTKKYSRIDDLSESQLTQSAEMLSKIIETYNEYYRTNHKLAKIKYYGSNEYVEIPIVD